jgi:hypothetical protein
MSELETIDPERRIPAADGRREGDIDFIAYRSPYHLVRMATDPKTWEAFTLASSDQIAYS